MKLEEILTLTPKKFVSIFEEEFVAGYEQALQNQPIGQEVPVAMPAQPIEPPEEQKQPTVTGARFNDILKRSQDKQAQMDAGQVLGDGAGEVGSATEGAAEGIGDAVMGGIEAVGEAGAAILV